MGRFGDDGDQRGYRLLALRNAVQRILALMSVVQRIPVGESNQGVWGRNVPRRGVISASWKRQPNARLGGHFGGNVGGEENQGGSRILVSKSVVQRIPVDESNPHGMWGRKDDVPRRRVILASWVRSTDQWDSPCQLTDCHGRWTQDGEHEHSGRMASDRPA